MKVRVFYLIFFLCVHGLLFADVHYYGEENTFSGEIEFASFYNENEKTLENLFVLKLDQPIASLPMPRIGDEKQDDQVIRKVLLYLTPDQLKQFDHLSDHLFKHCSIKGSIWYADWWIKELPFLLIANEVIFE